MTEHRYDTPPPPRKSDKLFRGDLRDWKNNACLTRGDDYAYKEGYRRGAQALVQIVRETECNQDFLVYPIVFLYRHHIELALKRVIRQTPYLLDRVLTKAETDHLGRHRLDWLWQDFKAMAKGVCEAAGWDSLPEEDVEGIDEYIRQMAEVDPGSYSLRYAQSKEGNPSLPKELTHINLRHFGDLMERLANYLCGLEMAVSHIEDLKREMEAAYYDDYAGDMYDDSYYY